MTFTVQAPTFTGPMDLLLKLAENGKLPAQGLALGQITTAYLEHVAALRVKDPDAISEFLRLSCRLLYIKSLALLPKADPDMQQAEITKLNLELTEYRQFRDAARALSLAAPLWHRQSVSQLHGADLPVPALPMQALQAAYVRALQRLPAIAAPRTMAKPPITQEAMGERLCRSVAKGVTALDTFLITLAGRDEIIVAFTALLELVKAERIVVLQADVFGSIALRTSHPLSPGTVNA